ncbi:MAG: hypothetical protein Q8P76_04445 [bacterium]|nr:hypothetical protein [bacterium]
MEKAGNFIQNLQDADEPTRKKWLIIFTAITMVIVIAFWSVYISYRIQDVNALEAQKDSPSFSEIFNSGLKILGAETMSKFKALMGDSQYLNTSGKDFKFTVENLEPVAPKQLP